MAESEMRQQAIEHVRAERQKWANLLAEVGSARLLAPGAMGDWTFKDLIAHLNGWWFFELDRLEAELAGRPEKHPWPDELSIDEINNWFYEANKDRPADAVVAESFAFFDRVEGLLERLPEATLTAPRRFEWMRGKPITPDFIDGCMGHLYDEHMPELRRWLSDTASP